MAFLLGQTKYVIKLPFGLFKKVLRYGLDHPEAESLKFSEMDAYKPVIEKILAEKEIPGMYLVQVECEDGLSEHDRVLVDVLNEMSISSWVGSTSLGFHIKRKPRAALNCILNNEDISEIIVSGDTQRRKNYRERRAARKEQAE